jgi:hypothetical protein
MTGESSINFDAPAELRKWPSLNKSASPGSRDIHGHRWPSRSVHPRVHGKARGRATPVRNPYGSPTAAHCGRSVPRPHSRAFAAEKFPVRQPFQKATTDHNSAPPRRLSRALMNVTLARGASYQRVLQERLSCRFKMSPGGDIPTKSELGQKRNSASTLLGVRFTPESGHDGDALALPRFGSNSLTGSRRRPEKPVYVPLQRSRTKPAIRLPMGKLQFARFSSCECPFHHKIEWGWDRSSNAGPNGLAHDGCRRNRDHRYRY